MSPRCEFWPHEAWPECSPLIPRKSLWRRLLCLFTGGHAWRDWFWGPFDESENCLTPEGSLQYCPKCAKMRHKAGSMAEMVAFFNLTGLCPDCRQGALVDGPRGGCAINMCCDVCGSQFNIAFLNGQAVHLERIQRRDHAH
jgi:hypothetical protein